MKPQPRGGALEGVGPGLRWAARKNQRLAIRDHGGGAAIGRKIQAGGPGEACAGEALDQAFRPRAAGDPRHLGHELRVATTDIPCEEGVVLVVEVLTNKSTYNQLELTSGRGPASLVAVNR